jgi:hypothetical protein
LFETDTSIFGTEVILGVRYKRREKRRRMKGIVGKIPNSSGGAVLFI